MIISHHGNISKPNNLIEAIKILKNNKHIDMIEIDVIFRNNIFMVSHDYDNMNHTSLETWLNTILNLGVKVWLDLKDTYISEIFPNKSQFNLAQFNKFMGMIDAKYHNMIFISSQFSTLKTLGVSNLGERAEALPRTINSNIYKYNIIQDTPPIFFYIIRFIPVSIVFRHFYNKYVQHYIYNKIKDTTDIIALDSEFFNNMDEMYDMILRLRSTNIIVCINGVENNKCKLKHIDNKNISYVYDYKL